MDSILGLDFLLLLMALLIVTPLVHTVVKSELLLLGFPMKLLRLIILFAVVLNILVLNLIVLEAFCNGLLFSYMDT